MPEAVATPAGESQELRGGSVARSTVVFAALTALSRLTALVREVLVARYFGVAGAMSAYTIAFQLPNLVRALVSDSALQGAFVPVFTELLEQGRRREAFRVAWTTAFLIVIGLGLLTGTVALLADTLAPVLSPGFGDSPALRDLTAGLTRVMFPTVIFFSLAGLVAAMLNSFDEFAAPVGGQIAFNLASVVGLVTLVPPLSGDSRIYAFAAATLAASAIQLVFPLPWLRGHDGRRLIAFDPRHPAVRRVMKLMLPVTIALGLFQFSLLLNSLIGTLVSEAAPAAIDRAFRIVVLPQGVFTLAITTVLFPTLARMAARGDRDGMRAVTARGIRVMSLLMIPSAAALIVLAEPATRLVYERGVFDRDATELVAGALAVWACSLPLQSATTFMAQAFFSLQRAWVPTGMSVVYVAVNAALGLALHGPLGVEGIVLSTVVANLVLFLAYARILGRALGGLDGRATAWAVGRMGLAGVVFAGVAWSSWHAIDPLVPDGVGGHALALLGAILAGTLAYAAAAVALRVPEAIEARGFLARAARRLRRRG